MKSDSHYKLGLKGYSRVHISLSGELLLRSLCTVGMLLVKR